MFKLRKKKLKTIDEYNLERREFYEQLYQPKKSGIACPRCGGELLFNPNVTLTSNPPQHYVDCPKCNYHGTILS